MSTPCRRASRRARRARSYRCASRPTQRPRPPRLKVFVTSDGLTDYVVAVSSRPKALAAWGVRQDLFKEGRAEETHDAALVEAALAKPGEVIAKGRDGALRTLKAARAPKPTSKPTAARSRRVE